MKKGDMIFKQGLKLEVLKVKGNRVAFLITNTDGTKIIRVVTMKVMPSVKKVA